MGSACLHPTSLKCNFFQDFKFVHKLQLFPRCCRRCSRNIQMSTQRVLFSHAILTVGRTHPNNSSQLVLQTSDDRCHKLLWMNLSTFCNSSNFFANIGALPQPCRRFCDVVHVHRYFHNLLFAKLLDELLMPWMRMYEVSSFTALFLVQVEPQCFQGFCNAPDSAHLVGPSNQQRWYRPFNIIPHFDCTRPLLRFIVVTSSK